MRFYVFDKDKSFTSGETYKAAGPGRDFSLCFPAVHGMIRL